MPIGSNLNITLPTSGLVQWDSTLNTALQALIDAVQAKVTVDGINIAASLDMQGNYLLNVDGLKFKTTTDDGTAQQLFWANVGGKPELFARDGAGNSIQITSGGSLNISLNGGISGLPFGTAAVTFSSAGASYTFTSAAGVYATLVSSDLQVHAGSASSYTDVKSSPVLGATYNLTLPSTTPASTLPVVMDSTGSLATTTNINGLTSLTASNAQFTSNVTMTGIEPASGYGLVVSNQTGSLSTIQSGSFKRWLDVSNATPSVGSPVYSSTGSWVIPPDAAVDLSVPYNEGDQLVSFTYNSSASGFGTTGSLFHRAAASTNVVVRKCFNGQSNCSFTAGAATMTGTLPYTPPGSGTLFLQVAANHAGTDGLLMATFVWLRKMV